MVSATGLFQKDSYFLSTNQNDYNTDDKVTAHDSQQFLLNFFTVFNQYQSNHFFVSGESYAGVYVPTLAQQVVLGNQQQNTPTINIKGILVGNGVTDQEFDGNAFPPFVHGHALIPDTLWVQLEAACGPSKYDICRLTFRLLERLWKLCRSHQ